MLELRAPISSFTYLSEFQSLQGLPLKPSVPFTSSCVAGVSVGLSRTPGGTSGVKLHRSTKHGPGL